MNKVPVDTNVDAGTDRPRPLPIRVRPHPGESVESYVRRLARANHLRPSYLHGYLTGPPYYAVGAIRPRRLAAITGRPLATLEHIFPSLKPRAPRDPQHDLRPTKPTRRQSKAALFAAIRRDAADGLSIRALANRHRVHRRTIRQALTNATPPSRKPLPRRSTRLNHLHAHINEMLEAHPDLPIQRIWEHLVDKHDAEVSYSTVGDYVAQQRQKPRARQTMIQSRQTEMARH